MQCFPKREKVSGTLNELSSLPTVVLGSMKGTTVVDIIIQKVTVLRIAFFMIIQPLIKYFIDSFILTLWGFESTVCLTILDRDDFLVYPSLFLRFLKV